MHQRLKTTLERLAEEKAPGPSPSFSLFHLLIALELIAIKSIGRKGLAQELEVGEGVARTIISRLRDAGLILASKTGCSLTEEGVDVWREYRSILRKVKVDKSELTFSDFNSAILARNRAHKVKSGIEQRDAAVMAGAKGATTILFKHGHLVFPSTDRDIGKSFPKASEQIVRVMQPQENDAIIIVSADSPEKAERAVLAAAWTLLDND